MGDVKIHSGQQRKSMGRLPATVSDDEELKITAGLSGSVVITFNPENGVLDEEEDRSLSRTRRGRCSNFKEVSSMNNKIQPGDSDTTNGSPSSGPSAYLDSVRNNLTYDYTSTPMMQDKSSFNSSGFGNNGCSSGYKLNQKRRNRGQDGVHHKPAEVYRKDLISAMKIPDTSQLAPEEYWVMKDSWRMDWEKGVQVPVNPGGLPDIEVETVPKEIKGDFRMPRKLIKTTPDVGDRDAVNLNVLADSMCRYDLDEVDVAWLDVINDERAWMGYQPLDEFTMEIIIEEMETQSHENLQLSIKTKEGLGIEYDENIVCDVCRTPDCEEGNEMVFCDGCNLCVHQACYGILKVPDGSWLCKPCALGIRKSAVCILCGKKGGAMKSTKSGRTWAHISCALWIPEITIADPERMEPITRVSRIPSSRWSLLCTVCKERSIGACIQCSVRHCVTPYHVTCAMENGFDMITDCVSPILAHDSGESDIVFRSYCQKHSKNFRKKSENSPNKKTEEEKRSDRQNRIAVLEEDFFTLVNCGGVADALNIPVETVTQVMEYWKLKRKANFNQPLVTPKQEESRALEEAAETGLQRRLRMFTHLRQDLERVRNLCYMIGKREKMKRSSVKIMSNVFLTQIHYLEYQMDQSSRFEPKLLMPSLPRFGSPKILERAKQESLNLAKTKEWSNSTPCTSETQSPDPGRDILEEGHAGRLAQPRMNANVTVNSSTETHHIAEQRPGNDGRKNGFVVDRLRKENKQKSKHSRKSEVTSQNTISYDSDARKNDARSKSNKKKAENLKKLNETGRIDSNLSNGESSDFAPATETRYKSHKCPANSFNKDCRDSGKKQRPIPIPTSESNRDTVKNMDTIRKLLARKGRLKTELNEISDDSNPELEKDSSVLTKDTDSTTTADKITKDRPSNLLSTSKNLKKQSKNKRDFEDKSSSVLDAKKKPEKTRRSSRHLEFSNSEDSDSSVHQLPAKPKMTISTETISETKRYNEMRIESEYRKRNWSRGTENASMDEKAKKPKLDASQSAEDHTGRRKLARIRQDASSAEDGGDATSTRSSRKSSKAEDSVENLSVKPQKRPSHRDSFPTTTVKNTSVKHQMAKNGQGALAPSRGQSRSEICNSGQSRSEICNKTGDIEAGQSPVRRLSGQELEDQKSPDLPPELSEDTPSIPTRKLPRSGSVTPPIILEKPNPAFIAAGLDIGYGSNAPVFLRQNSHKKLPTMSSGLKWVSLVDDITEDNTGYPNRVATPKDQEGYRGDMDESDSESQNSLHKHHHRKMSTRKRSSLNPGKYRIDTDVLSPKSSDCSSGDDFDLPFSSSRMGSAEKKQRQKLRSINNTNLGVSTDATVNFSTTSRFSSARSIKSQQKVASPAEANDSKITEPKNVGAVGGIQGSLKSEHDLASPSSFMRTTDGQDSQDNVFDKFANFKEGLLTPFYDPTQDDPQPFTQSQFMPPGELDFHGCGVPLQSQTLFPYGAINPWELSQPTSLPSIIPNQYPLPVYYQYSPPSPPPMPDSTLSPESFVPGSTSVAVQVSERSITPSYNKTDKVVEELSQIARNNKVPGDDVADNEWEIVQEGHGGFPYDDDSAHRKHKKKKKKKRKRMLFPDGYDSERRETSSTERSYTEPTHGAIVPRGHSTQYDVNRNLGSEIDSSSAQMVGDDRGQRISPGSQKLVLKINKRDLVMKEERIEKKNDTFKTRIDETFSSGSSVKTEEESGLKLTSKKSQYEHILKKYKHERKVHSSGHEFSAYTVSPASRARFLLGKPKIERKSAAVRRLGLDVNDLPDTEPGNDGVGRRVLRERKSSVKKEEETTSKAKKRVRPRLSTAETKAANSPPKLRRRDPLNDDRSTSKQNSIAVTHGASKRGRGRPRKIHPVDTLGIKQEPSLEAKQVMQNKSGENRDLARFARWSRKSSKSSGFKPRHSLPDLGSKESPYFALKSTGPCRSKPGGVSIRSFFTDSDQTSTVNAPGQHPARHWKKRKVREHETQSSLEHPIHNHEPSTTETSIPPGNNVHLQSISSHGVAREKKSSEKRSSDISQPVKSRVNREDHTTNVQRQKDSSSKAALIPQSVRLSTEHSPGTRTLNLNLDQIAPPSSLPKGDKPSLSSPSKQKSPSKTPPLCGTTAKSKQENQGTARPSASTISSSESASPKTRVTTPTKHFPPEYNLGFAMQTGPLNSFKIPKKLHQKKVESNLPTDTLD